MILRFLTASAAAAALAVSAASANEMVEACKAALEAEGRDTSGCDCLAAEIAANAALEAEFNALGQIADAAERYAAASDDAKAAMDKCTR